MFQRIYKHVHHVMRHYWIFIAVLAFVLLSVYTSHPMYGAPAATATPDVNTVPQPEATPTPENTPFPTPTEVIEDPFPEPDSGDVVTEPEEDNNDSGQNNGGGSSGAPAENNDTATGGGSVDTETTDGSLDALPETEQAGSTGPTGFVTAVTLNLRKGPSTTARVIDTLFLNDQVALLGRDNTGGWWYVCCGARTQLAGWVSNEFIQTTISGDEAMTLLSVVSNTAPAATTAQTTTTANAATNIDDGSLTLEMRPVPLFAWQGQTIDIQFVVRNRSDQALTAVQLRNDLPAELAVVKANIGEQGEVSYTGALEGGPIFTIDWPELPAKGQVTATVTVQIAGDVADGALIDSLSVVKTAQGVEALAGITLAMPPITLPQFR